MALHLPVFISYRKDDAQPEATSLARDLGAKLTPDVVFLDTLSIEYGEEYPARLVWELDR